MFLLLRVVDVFFQKKEVQQFQIKTRKTEPAPFENIVRNAREIREHILRIVCHTYSSCQRVCGVDVYIYYYFVFSFFDILLVLVHRATSRYCVNIRTLALIHSHKQSAWWQLIRFAFTGTLSYIFCAFIYLLRLVFVS